MATEGLTAKQVQHAQPREKRYEMPAGGGLYAVIHPSGKKGWALRYRWRGKTRNLTFATGYPEMTLSAARAEAESKLKDLEKDIDPASVQAEEKAAEPDSVEAVAEEWIARHLEVNVEWPDAIRILKNNIVKPWKHKLITDVSRADVLRVLDAVVDRGAAVQANRTLAVLRAWLNWCVERGILPVSPANGVKPPTTEQSRDRVLSPAELSEVWAASASLGYPFGPFTRFLALSAQRRGEVSTMRWQDVDLDKAIWTLPKEMTKAGRVHDVPLSSEAIAILESLPRFTAGHHVWTTTSGAKPINGFSKLKSRIDAATLKAREKAGIKKNIPDWTLHDLRRSCATHLAKSGVPPHVVAAILNHTPGSTQGVTSIYNRFRYTEERRAALQLWADFVVGLEAEKKGKATA